MVILRPPPPPNRFLAAADLIDQLPQLVTETRTGWTSAAGRRRRRSASRRRRSAASRVAPNSPNQPFCEPFAGSRSTEGPDMVIRLAATARNASTDGVVDLVDAGAGAGTLKIYTGTQVATGDTAEAGTLLATVTFADPAFGASSAWHCGRDRSGGGDGVGHRHCGMVPRRGFDGGERVRRVGYCDGRRRGSDVGVDGARDRDHCRHHELYATPRRLADPALCSGG